MTTILAYIAPQPTLHPGRCYVCFKLSDSPIICVYNFEINGRIKICADVCLSKYNTLDRKYRKKAEEKMIKQPKFSNKMEIARSHLQALQVPKFNDDLKLEDIEDFDLDGLKEGKKS